MTRQDYRCPRCKTVQELVVPLGQKAHAHCLICGVLMQRFFGKTDSADLLINYGYRDSRYTNETDARIAQYQFTHL